MRKMSIQVSRADDNHVRIKLMDEDGGSARWIDLDPTTTEAIIDDIAMVRASLKEKPSKTLEISGSRFGAGHIQIDPDWHFHDILTLEGETRTDLIPIALRQEGMGWLLFGLPYRSAKAIGKRLIEKASTNAD